MSVQVVGQLTSSILGRSILVSENEYKSFDALRKKEIIDSIFSTEDKLSTFLMQVRDQLPNLIFFKQRFGTDPLILVDSKTFKPVITVDQSYLYLRQTVANAVMLFNFIRNFFKSKLPTGQIPVIASALTDILVPMKVKPISDELLRDKLLPEIVVYVSYMFHSSSLSANLVFRYYSQIDTLTIVKSKTLEELLDLYKKENISTAVKLFPRLEKIVGLENLQQRLVIRYGVNDILFLFDQPFYLYTLFNGSLNFKISPIFYQSISEKTGRKLKSYVEIYTT